MDVVKLQGDDTVRRVHENNLRAMCDNASGMSHTYTLDIGKTRAAITYSNPDEYGWSAPYTVRFPIAPDGRGGVWVYLDMTSDSGARDDYDREAAYQVVDGAILSAAPLWRNPTSGAWDEAHRAYNLPQYADEAIRQALRALDLVQSDEAEAARKRLRIVLDVGNAPYVAPASVQEG